MSSIVTSTCPHCKKTVAEGGEKYRGKFYHPSCLEKMKKAARKKDGVKSAQVNDPELKALVDYVCRVFSLPALTPLLQKQIEDMHLNHSYADLLIAARYFFEYDKGARQHIENVSLGILPFIMNDAKAFDSAIKKAKQVPVKAKDTVVVRVSRPDTLVPTAAPMDSL